jgi:FKBP-type peptidyl-prolyl cis-trans isomerase
MKKIIGLTIISLVFLGACGGKKSGKTKSGIEYTIHSSKKGKKIKVGDFVTMHYLTKGTGKNGKDTVLESTFKTGQPIKDLSVPEPKDNYMFEALLLFAEGDSATFKIPNDSLVARQKTQIRKQVAEFKKQEKSLDTMKNIKQKEQNQAMLKQQIDYYEKMIAERPKELPEKKYTSVTVKILKVQDAKQKQEEAKKAEENAKKEAEKQKGIDDKLINEYAKKNNLKIEKTPSGLAYIIEKEGQGEKIKMGEIAKVNYKGELLNGKVFDTSIEEEAKKAKLKQQGRKYEPFEVSVGMGQVIRGWDEGLQLLKKGSKAIFLIPSGLAYGTRAAGTDIPANSVLRFEIEVLDVKTQEQVQKEMQKNSPKPADVKEIK